jgi:hypothetical protein
MMTTTRDPESPQHLFLLETRGIRAPVSELKKGQTLGWGIFDESAGVAGCRVCATPALSHTKNLGSLREKKKNCEKKRKKKKKKKKKKKGNFVNFFLGQIRFFP